MAQDKGGTDFNMEGNDIIKCRFNHESKKKINETVARYPGIYESNSHFIRCAVERELRRLEAEKPEMEAE